MAALILAVGVSAPAQSLLLKSGAIDPKSIPAAKVASIPKIQALASGERRVVLVQWSSPIDAAKLKALEGQGAQIIQPVPDQGYLVALPASVSVSGLAGVKSATAPSWASVMDPSWKLHPEVSKSIETNAAARLSAAASTKQVVRRYVIQAVKTGGEAAVQKALSSRGFSAKQTGQMSLVENWTVEADDDAVASLSYLNSVIWIEPYREPKLHGEREALAVSGNFKADYSDVVDAGSSVYQAWLNSVGLSGAGVVVHVMDDGLSQGNYSNIDGTAHPDIVGRIVGIDNATTDESGDSGGGHGHLNASIIMGRPIAAGGLLDKDGYKLGQGVAPNARVYATKIFNNFDAYDVGGRTFNSMVSTAYIAGARISSNSWGASVNGEYDSQAQLYDYMTRDASMYETGLQPMTFVFSASNDGPYPQSMGSPGTGKNMISVGAMENADQGLLDGSGMGPEESNDMRDVAIFSSRGPLADGRIGPTIAAVGVHVPGAASDSRNFNGSGVSGRDISSLERYEPVSNTKYYPANQHYYTWSSGTSHSCPTVAGEAALFYEWYLKTFGSAPSPALVKAALIAGAIDPVGGQVNRGGEMLGFAPNNEVGWGFTTLKGVVDGSRQILIRDQTKIFTENSQTFYQNVQVPDSTKPLRIVLTWTDVPGYPGASKSLVNDLDLSVTDGTTIWKGNVFTNGRSTEGGEADRVNNVECVFIPNPTPSVYTIMVKSASLNGDALPGVGGAIEQDFALIVTNGADQTPVGRASFDKAIYACSDPIQISVSDSDLKGAGTTTVDVSSQLTGDTETIVLNEVPTRTGIMRGTLSCNSEDPTAGDGVLSVRDGDTITAVYHDATKGSNGQPLVSTATARLDCSAPALSDVTIDEVTDESATISVTASEAAQIAIVYGTAGAETSLQVVHAVSSTSHTFTLTGLTAQTDYFFKVRMTDAAGNSATAGNINDTYFGFQTRGRETVLFEQIETGIANRWSHIATVGTDDWHPATSAAYVKSPTHSWFSADVNSVKDDRLFAPIVALPNGDVRMEFWHTYEFEHVGVSNGYDGGVLEITDDGGASWTDLGPYILEGGYNSTISSYFDNPLAGRHAWSGGQLGSLTRVLVDLSAYRGKTVQVRWRIGCDSSRAGNGWYIDDVSIYSYSDITTPLALLRFDQDGFSNSTPSVHFSIRDQQFSSTDEGQTPADFFVSVPGRLAPVAIDSSLLTLNPVTPEMDVWDGYLPFTTGSQPGHVLVAGAVDVLEGERVRLIYYDYNDGAGHDVYVSDDIRLDSTPPTVTSFTSSGVSDSSSVYHLTTSEPARIKVHYGTSPSYLTLLIEDNELATEHDINFENLAACKAYYFYVEVTDQAGNTTVLKNQGELFGFRTCSQTVTLDTLDPAPTLRWSHSAAMGTDDWTYVIKSSAWNANATGYVRSGVNAWSCADVPELKDDSLVLGPFTITSMMKLSFWHTYQLEKTFDGAVIEVSTDGGKNWIDLGPEIIEGRYTGIISGNFHSPISNRSAWTGGMLGTMTQVIVDLRKYSGSDRLIRFRLGCDTTQNQRGWMIDDVSLISYDTCGTQFPAEPQALSPLDNAKGVPFNQPALYWEKIKGATKYQVFFGTSADSLALLGETTNNYYVVPQVLKAGRRYYWAVRAFNSVGAGDVGSAVSFKTATVDPAAIGRHIIGKSSLMTSEKTAVDYNNDGMITIDELVTDVNNSR
ncbi:S8 family serine peptidase [bacterium]|nr:S8 family serine peptidase [bacterium]